MNKISIYALTFFLSLSSVTVYSQKNNKQVIFTNEQGSDIFYHTIERGQTVYAIATMYGVSVEDIYRLNPESKEGIKAGSTLRIPQKDSAIAPSGKADNYTYHTIQPKETLYSLSIKYSVPATDIIAANPGLSTSTFTIGKNIRIPPTRLETLPIDRFSTYRIAYPLHETHVTVYASCNESSSVQWFIQQTLAKISPS